MLITKKRAQSFIPSKKLSSNKTDHGHVMIIAGNNKLLGAGILASLAATKSGAGYTHLMSELDLKAKKYFPDFILHPINSKSLNKKENFAFAIGPGLGIEAQKRKLLISLKKNKYERVVVDADALSILSKLNTKLPSAWILTPHEGEAARLLGKTDKFVKNNRLSSLVAIHKKYGCHVLLKGQESLIIDDRGEVYKTKFANQALAKAGKLNYF